MPKLVAVKKPASHGTTKHLMFQAVGYELAWGDVANGWMLMAPDGDLLRTLPNLISGLSELERVSGCSSKSFTVTDNPFNNWY